MKGRGTALALAASLLIGNCAVFDVNIVEAEINDHKVDEKIFKWVQSSSRMGYYFNQEQICYKVVNGEIDLDTLIVPVLKVYDPVQIKDTVDKRRWHMQSLNGFGDLVGRSEFAEIKISSRTVTIGQAHYLDSTWTTIESFKPDTVMKLDEMSDKNLEKIFFTSVLDYAQRHQLELALRTRGDLHQELQDKIAQQQQEYIDSKDNPEKYAADQAAKAAQAEKDKKKNKKKNKDKDKK